MFSETKAVREAVAEALLTDPLAVEQAVAIIARWPVLRCRRCGLLLTANWRAS